MSSQQITPELRQWIVDQARAGHRPEAVLSAMRASGWDEAVALQAMESTLQGYLDTLRPAGAQPSLPPGGAAAAAAGGGVAVPEPDLRQHPSVVRAADRDVQVLLTLENPRVVVFGGLLSHEECDQLVELARPRLARSETVDIATGGSEVNAARTSSGMFFNRGESALHQRIEQRIAALVRWPVDNGEGLQVLRYGPGAEYRPHHDYFDPEQPGTPAILQRGGQRVGTVVMYLNTPAQGGGTTFPEAGLEVAPFKGNAVFFSYARPHPDTRTLHGGAPVITGEKWVATKWLRERVFV